jgi:hypothetical protein
MLLTSDCMHQERVCHYEHDVTACSSNGLCFCNELYCYLHTGANTAVDHMKSIRSAATTAALHQYVTTLSKSVAAARLLTACNICYHTAISLHCSSCLPAALRCPHESSHAIAVSSVHTDTLLKGLLHH